MKSFKQFLQFLTEMAIPLSMYKDLARNWKPDKKYFEIFKHYNTGPRKNKKPYRIYLRPGDYINKTNSRIEARTELINKAFEDAHKKGYINDYEVEDYITGFAITKDGKRRSKIGKIFNKMIKEAEKRNDDMLSSYKDLYDMFINDKERIGKGDKYLIVISHHAYDLAAMTANRRWQNCRDIIAKEDPNYLYTYVDICTKSLIAYAIDPNDTNIQDPRAMKLIRTFVNIEDPNKFIFVPEKHIYGDKLPGFEETIEKWCEDANKRWNGEDYSGFFIYDTSMGYTDTLSEVISVKKDIWEIDLQKLINTTFKLFAQNRINLASYRSLDFSPFTDKEFLEKLFVKMIENIDKITIPRLNINSFFENIFKIIYIEDLDLNNSKIKVDNAIKFLSLINPFVNKEETFEELFNSLMTNVIESNYDDENLITKIINIIKQTDKNLFKYFIILLDSKYIEHIFVFCKDDKLYSLLKKTLNTQNYFDGKIDYLDFFEMEELTIPLCDDAAIDLIKSDYIDEDKISLVLSNKNYGISRISMITYAHPKTFSKLSNSAKKEVLRIFAKKLKPYFHLVEGHEEELNQNLLERFGNQQIIDEYFWKIVKD